ncbi:MAG: hypothetical protein QM831_07850 [Kofleriaceae bacterium]
MVRRIGGHVPSSHRGDTGCASRVCGRWQPAEHIVIPAGVRAIGIRADIGIGIRIENGTGIRIGNCVGTGIGVRIGTGIGVGIRTDSTGISNDSACIVIRAVVIRAVVIRAVVIRAVIIRAAVICASDRIVRG